MLSRCTRSLLQVAKMAKSSSLRAQSTVAPLSNRYYLFNYFEQPEDDEVFKKVWTPTSGYLKNFNAFCGTFLHHSSNPKTKYPWINFAVSESTEVPYLGMKDDKWPVFMKEAMSYGFKANPAGFREIGSFSGAPLIADNKLRPDSARFFITGVKVQDNITDEDFENNWKEWTGTEFLHNQLKNDNNLVDSHFYKRFTTKMAPTFRYTVRTEMKGMSDASGHAIAEEVNSRPNIPAGVESFTGFYRVAIPVVP